MLYVFLQNAYYLITITLLLYYGTYTSICKALITLLLYAVMYVFYQECLLTYYFINCFSPEYL